jgi:hypothetical protein
MLLASTIRNGGDGVTRAGFVLQVDCPDLAAGWNTSPEQLTVSEFRRRVALVGRENALAGSDCGFATFSGFVPVDAKVTWAKLAAMAEGARLASARLWGHP